MRHWAGRVRTRWSRAAAGRPGGRARALAAAGIVPAALLVTALATRGVFGQLPVGVPGRWGWSTERFLAGDVRSAATAPLLTRDAFMLASLVTSTGLFGYLLARVRGGATMLAVWAAGAVWGYAATAVVVAGLAAAGWPVAIHALQTPDYGPSAGTAALAGGLVVALRDRGLTGLMSVALVTGSVLHHKISDVEHLLTYGTVLAIGWFTVRRPLGRAGRHRRRPTRVTSC